MGISGRRPIAALMGTAFVASLGSSALADTNANPFVANDLAAGYDQYAPMAEGKCGEGKCGGDKAEGEGKCGEGSCGGDKAEGEGKCGEGSCGDDKAEGEGKCGEGKCGG